MICISDRNVDELEQQRIALRNAYLQNVMALAPFQVNDVVRVYKKGASKGVICRISRVYIASERDKQRWRSASYYGYTLVRLDNDEDYSLVYVVKLELVEKYDKPAS